MNENFTYDFRRPISCNAELVQFVCSGFMLSAALFSATELDVFSLIASGKRSCAELAVATKVPAAELERLLAFCVGLGLLSVSRDTYSNTPVANALLIRGTSSSLLPVLAHYQRHVYPLFTNLTEALRSGNNLVGSWAFRATDLRQPTPVTEMYEELSRCPEEYARFIQAMDIFSKGVGASIADSVAFDDNELLVDLGCGGGAVSVELASKLPGIAVIAVDQPVPLSVAREQAARAGVSERVSFLEGDIRGAVPLPSECADSLLISAVLGDWDEQTQLHILGEGLRLLKPGGRLIVSETLLADDGTGPLAPALLSLYVLVLTQGGRNFTASSLSKLLLRAGFESIDVLDKKHQGVRDLAVAKKRQLGFGLNSAEGSAVREVEISGASGGNVC